MLWAVLSQKFEVVELFLEYSGTYRQCCTSDQYSFSTNKGVFQICNALAVSCLLKGMAKLLKHDNAVTRNDLNKLIEKSQDFDQIATDLLDCAITNEECSLRTLLNTPSPFWGNKTALELARIGNAYKFMNHHAISIYLSQVWKGYDAIRQKEGGRYQYPGALTSQFCTPPKFVSNIVPPNHCASCRFLSLWDILSLPNRLLFRTVSCPGTRGKSGFLRLFSSSGMDTVHLPVCIYYWGDFSVFSFCRNEF